MVRVDTSFLLSGHSEPSGAIVIPSSPPLPSFQRPVSSSSTSAASDRDGLYAAADAAAPADRTELDSLILVPSTPESQTGHRLSRPDEGGRRMPEAKPSSQTGKHIWDDGDWAFPGSPEAAPEEAAAPEPALRRRRDWTPPPADTVVVDSDTSSAAVETWSSPRHAASQKRKQTVFQNLHDSFSCKEDPMNVSRAAERPAEKRPEPFVKRKEIVMLPIGDAGPAPKPPSPLKTKAPKRKARTITELAVAAYVTPDPTEADTVADEADLSAAMRPPAAAKKGRVVASSRSAAAAASAAINPGLPLTKVRKGIKARPKEKAKRGPRKAKAAAAEDRVLLSPQSAMTESAGQDFVFGTSSQLAGDESPTFLRSLQMAMQSSNRQDDEADADTSPPSPTTRGPHSRSRLWMVSARIDGKLMADHVIDLEDDISFPVDPDAVVRAEQEEARTQAKGKQPAMPLPEKPAADATEEPNFEALTTAELAKQVSSYGYKPLRGRKAMISLLSQCWNAKTNNNQPPAGRPVHTSSRQEKRIVLEIEDSEESDCRLSSASPEPEMSLSPSAPQMEEGDMSLDATLSGEDSDLFRLIMAVVTAEPRTNDPAHPSWHEKMLMFDTIILETFTAWLNDGQLARVGYAGDAVDEEQVKKWCQSKSVCCSSIRNTRGKERKL